MSIHPLRGVAARFAAGALLIPLFALAGCDSTSVGPDGVSRLVFSDSSMPLGLISLSYTEELGVSGGTAPYTFSVDEAELPPGLAPGKSSGAFSLAGTPTADGTYTFTLTVTDATDASASAAVSVVVVTNLEPAGDWSYDTLVTEAHGGCDGEAGDRTVHQVSITRVGNQVTLDGLLGISGNEVTGTWSGNRLTLSGTYPEEGGHTTGTHNLVFHSPDLIKGIEDWDWTPGGPADPGVCPLSVSRLIATRVP